MKRTIKSFTLIELLVVIVIIGILAGVIIVSTTSSINSAKNAKMVAELSNLSKAFEGYSHYYVGSLCIEDTANNANFLSYYSLTTVPKHDGYVAGQTALTTNNCYLYFSDGKEYSIRTPSVGNKGYLIQESRTQKTQPLQTSCDAGWIPFGNRCIMKYEAKCTEYPAGGYCIEGTSTLISQAVGTPWVSITQDQAKAECEKIGAHLITNAEWMAIARDIEATSSNWTGTVLNRGHTDNVPPNALAASTDNDPYYGTGQTTGEQKRTHTLSNGEVIWDFAGNVYEWVDETITDGEQYINFNSKVTGWHEYNEEGLFDVANKLPYSEAGPKGTYTTPSASGMGRIYIKTSNGSSTNRAFLRSVHWADTSDAGVFALVLDGSPSLSDGRIGFRCAR